MPLRTTRSDELRDSWFSLWETWAKGVIAAAIAGSANGIITGFAAVGIDPSHFNLQSGMHATLGIATVSATMSGIIGVAAYLKQSPLPPDGCDESERRDEHDVRDERDVHDEHDAHDGRDVRDERDVHETIDSHDKIDTHGKIDDANTKLPRPPS